VSNEPPKVFISYSQKDKTLARALEEQLRVAGAEVWVDHRGIRGGDNLPAEISNALRWCNTLLLIWSISSADSYWVELEWTNALSLRKKIIPCLLDDTPLPPILSNKAYIEMSDVTEGTAQLLQSLEWVTPRSETKEQRKQIDEQHRVIEDQINTDLKKLTKRQPDQLRIFISSRMQELEDLRVILHRELKRFGIDAFVYEVELGARPDDPETVTLLEIERADVFVLVIGGSYGAITEREYDWARELNKPCLVYEQLGRSTTDEKLQRFIDKLSGPRGVPSRSKFQNAVDLAEKVAKDVQGWLTREYRRLSAERLASPKSSRRTEKD